MIDDVADADVHLFFAVILYENWIGNIIAERRFARNRMARKEIKHYIESFDSRTTKSTDVDISCYTK